MAPKPGQSLGGADLEVLESQAQVAEAEDIDIDQWLSDQAAESQRVETIEIGGKAIRIAVVDEGEENRLIKQSKRRKPGSRDEQVDMLAYRRAYVAFSLSKASGRQINPEDARILKMPPGIITRLMSEIQKLSAYELPEQQQQSPFQF